MHNIEEANKAGLSETSEEDFALLNKIHAKITQETGYQYLIYLLMHYYRQPFELAEVSLKYLPEDMAEILKKHKRINVMKEQYMAYKEAYNRFLTIIKKTMDIVKDEGSL